MNIQKTLLFSTNNKNESFFIVELLKNNGIIYLIENDLSHNGDTIKIFIDRYQEAIAKQILVENKIYSKNIKRNKTIDNRFSENNINNITTNIKSIQLIIITIACILAILTIPEDVISLKHNAFYINGLTKDIFMLIISFCLLFLLFLYNPIINTNYQFITIFKTLKILIITHKIIILISFIIVFSFRLQILTENNLVLLTLLLPIISLLIFLFNSFICISMMNYKK